jgi:ribonuclease P protein component
LAYAVSGAPSAVVRNRVRRRLRAASARAEPTAGGGAYLVSARPEAMTMSFRELVDTLSTLFATAGERA